MHHYQFDFDEQFSTNLVWVFFKFSLNRKLLDYNFSLIKFYTNDHSEDKNSIHENN